MALNKAGEWNNIPEALKQDFPADGTVVTYRYLHSTIDPITKKAIWPAVYQIPAKCKLKDPSKPGSSINVGMIGSLNQSGQPIDDEIQRTNIYPMQSRGLIRFVAGNNPETDNLIAFLPYSDINISNPNRDTRREPVLEYVDYKEEATKKREAFSKKKDAWMHARNLSTAQIERAGLLLGFNTNVDEVELRYEVENYADVNPQGYFDKINDPDAENIAVVKQAIMEGVLSIDEAGHVLRWSDGAGIFQTISATEIDAVSAEVAAALRDNREGATLIGNLKKMLEKAKPAKKGRLSGS